MDRIIPYVEYEGAWTFPDAYIFNLWEKMCLEGTAKRVFHGGMVKNRLQFIAWLKNRMNRVALIVEEDGEPLILSWINCIDDGRANFNFNVFKKAWGKSSSDLLKKSADYWFSLKTPEGDPIIRLLMGFTPSDNKLALKIVKSLSDGQLQEIPNFFTNYYTGRRCGAVISYLENKSG